MGIQELSNQIKQQGIDFTVKNLESCLTEDRQETGREEFVKVLGDMILIGVRIKETFFGEMKDPYFIARCVKDKGELLVNIEGFYCLLEARGNIYSINVLKKAPL